VDKLELVDNPVDKSIVITPSILYYGMPITLISTVNELGEANISPISSSWALGDRVVLGFGMDAQGFLNMEQNRECVINVASRENLASIGKIADTTGRNPPSSVGREYRFEPDKFTLGGFTKLESDLVKPPRIAECKLQLEAKVLAIHLLAGDCGLAAVETQIVRVHAHPDIVVAGTNHIDPQQWHPLFYVFRHYFSTGARLGKNSWAEI
jgi:flavin reductase (DIM6/NTAB) family NADH-FMN oxidoreductase RutF